MNTAAALVNDCELSTPDVDGVTSDLYDAFTRAHGRFAETSRCLVALAGDLVDADVVDMGCGTGVVTRELLRVSEGTARIVALDTSPGMLAHARRSVGDARVRFVCGSGDEVDRIVDEVDAVVCNAAIWHMDPERLAAAVRRALRPGGRFVFNFARPGEPMSALHEAMRSIAAQDGFVAAQLAPAVQRRGLIAAVRAAGLVVERAVETLVHESSASQRDFLRLPGSTYRTLPGVPYAERLRILERAWLDVGDPQPQDVRWIHVRTVKPG